MYRVVVLATVFATVCLGATPGTLVAPGGVEVVLKDGNPFNITCPSGFIKDLGNFFQPGDYEDISAACLKGRLFTRLTKQYWRVNKKSLRQLFYSKR